MHLLKRDNKNKSKQVFNNCDKIIKFNLILEDNNKKRPIYFLIYL